MPDQTPTPRAVFLSYAREDSEAVRRIADALRAFGVEVWFDQNELRGGDAWDQKIRTQIRTCTLCVPVISAATQARGEGYFRREWKLAIERTHDMAAGVPFLLPVAIDDTAESEALVPDEFMRVQWTRLAHGVPTPQFVEQVKRLLDAGRRPALPMEAGRSHSPMEAGRPRPAMPTLGEVTVPPRRPAISGWIWGALTAAVLAAVAAVWFVVRRPAPTGAPVNASAEAKPSGPAAAPVVNDKSIAVLPFENMSEDKGNAFFADGMQEDILTNLALIREFRVVSRTSVMPYRTTTKSIRQIAQELGVTYILEGSVQREGNKVRVTGQLIQAAKDEHVWAKAYDRDLTDVFAIQAELSQEIATALKTVLSPQEKVRISRRPTENPAAYDLFLRARDAQNRDGSTPASRESQTKLLQSAVELDPKFGEAWAELADALAFAYFNEDEGKDALLVRAKTAIDRAVQLAPDDPAVISSLGTYYYYGYRDYVHAAEQYQRLAAMQPNDPTVFNSLGLIQRRQGHWVESLANTRRATELDPANLNYLRNLLATLTAGRRWDEAIAVQRRIVTLLPDKLAEAYQLAVLAFQATGSTKEGRAFFAGLTSEQLNSPRGIDLRESWAAETGNFAEAVQLDRLQPYFDDDGTPHWQQAFGAALSYLALGDAAAAKARLGTFPAELRDRMQREPGNLIYSVFSAGMETVLGNNEEARREMDRAVELMPLSRDAVVGPSYALFRASVLDWTGEKEQALAEYARLLRIPGTTFGNVHDLKTGYSTMHGDPRFEALLDDPKNNAPLF